MRRFIIGLGALAAILVAADTVVWELAERRLQVGLDLWAEDMRLAGWVVSLGEPTRGGWPLAAELIVDHAGLATAPGLVPLVWTGERTVLRLTPADLTALELRLYGVQELRVARAPPLRFAADRMVATVPLRAGTPIDIVGQALHAAGTTLAEQWTVGLLHGRFSAPNRSAAGEPVLDFSGNAQAVTLPPPSAGGSWALGPRLASASLDGGFGGAIPPATDGAAQATAWRDRGGGLVIRRLALGWGALGASGSGSLGLDAALQPAGSGTVRVVGWAETIASLAAARVITPGQATAASAILSLLARTPDGGGASEVELPLILQDRTLSLGPIPLLRAPPIDWSAH